MFAKVALSKAGNREQRGVIEASSAWLGHFGY